MSRFESFGALLVLSAVGCAAAPPSTPAPKALTATTAPSPPRRSACVWPLYEAYTSKFVESGRVVDITTGGRTTSEGQAYGLFFALVANDQQLFDQIAAWTRENLLAGAWDQRLPAWLWGANKNGQWGVLDENAATDADLWMVYAFMEASGLWGRPELLTRAKALLSNVVKVNLRHMEGLGPMLLPGPKGFVLDEGKRWRLNPSYFVFPQLWRFQSAGLPGPWKELVQSAQTVLVRASLDGHTADWIIYDAKDGFLPDSERRPESSYDAIRVAMWAAFDSPNDVFASVRGRIALFESDGRIAERVWLDSTQAKAVGRGPPGFAAALLPVAHRLGASDLLQRLRARLDRSQRGALYGSPPTYYDQNLALFGLGFTEGRFAFGPRGELEVPWRSSPCSN